jgi:hypothetical protein
VHTRNTPIDSLDVNPLALKESASWFRHPDWSLVREWQTPAARLLDVIIVANTGGLIAFLLVGGFDLGVWSVSSLAKPVLVLLLLVPARLALPCPGGTRSFIASVSRGAELVWARLAVHAAIRDILPIASAVMAMMFVVGCLANILFEPQRSTSLPGQLLWQKFLESFAVWDGAWYFDIARRGYYYVPDGQSSIAFFPLYPLLVRAVAWPFGSSAEATLLAGVALSCAAFLAALIVLHRLTAHITGSPETARRAALYLAVFPFSFYFTRVYTEALFLLLTVTAIWWATQSRWLLAGIAGALAAATRPNGIVIAVPLVIMAFGDRPTVTTALRRLSGLSVVAAGPLIYSAYVYSLTGDPFLWLRAQEHWGYSLWHLPSRHLVTIAKHVEEMGLYHYLVQGGDAPYELLYATVALGSLALVPRVVSVCGVGLAAYVVVSLLIPMSGNVLVGMGRYVSVLFPLFIALATVTSPRVHEAILIASSLFLAVLLALFVGWYPLY